LGAFQWGFLVATILTAIWFPAKAVKKENYGNTVGLILLGGVLVEFFLFLAPSDLGHSGGFLAFCYGVLLPTIPSIMLAQPGLKRNKIIDLADREAFAVRRQALDELRGRARVDEVAFRESFDDDWVHNGCTVDGATTIIALKKDFRAVCIVSYEVGDVFSAGVVKDIPIEQIISCELQRENIVEKFYRTELVPVSQSNKRSPVGRAVVGGLLLGPAGLVMGAASGLGGKTTITTKEIQVRDERVVEGPPVLVLSTVNEQNDRFKIRFAEDALAEHWEHQIRAARVRFGLSY